MSLAMECSQICFSLREAVVNTPAIKKSLPTCFHASFCPFCPFCWPSLFLPFFGIFSPLSAPGKLLFSVERRAQHPAWRGAVSGWTSPQSSGRKSLSEICAQKGQARECGCNAMVHSGEKVSVNRLSFLVTAGLFSNFILPAAAIVFLDIYCLGRWPAFWAPCIVEPLQRESATLPHY